MIELPELHLPGQPFDGLNLDRARAINGALIGYEVQIHGKKDFDSGAREGRRARSEVYVFLGLCLPASIKRSPFDVVYDLRLQRGRHGGHYRHISPQLVTRFEVVSAEELTPCVDCGRWQPMRALKDTAYRPLDMRGYGLVCRKNCDNPQD